MDFTQKVNENVGKIKNKIKAPKKDHISGIHCQVTNCMYHDPKCKCTANQITVSPDAAANSSDTACSTFKQK